MKPPQCICGLRLQDIPEDANLDDHFELVRFADYWIPDIDDWCGHPRGAEWFCVQHAALAMERTGLTSREAHEEIKVIIARDRPTV